MTNAQQKVVVGAALIVAGSWLLHEGYEKAGRKRPFLTKFLPGG
jgi:hypothetical protein